MFEKYQITADSDNNIMNSDAVDVLSLNVANKDIGSLSGIEAFTALTNLDCFFNELTELDVSANTALTNLDCRFNSLTELNVSENTALTVLNCNFNDLTGLDVSVNTALENLFCLSNELTSLNVKNGSNNILQNLQTTGNPSLTCIEVDDASNVPPSTWVKEATASYSNDCSTLSNKDFELSGVSISPNPTTGILNITTVEKTEYKLLNIRGQILEEGVLATGEGKINVSYFAKGVYFLGNYICVGTKTSKIN